MKNTAGINLNDLGHTGLCDYAQGRNPYHDAQGIKQPLPTSAPNAYWRRRQAARIVDARYGVEGLELFLKFTGGWRI